MKFLFTFLSALLLVSQLAVGQRKCSEPFVSEIVYSGDGSGNYAVEVFNPTGSAINLANYKIELFSFQGEQTTISLTGTIPAEDVVVVSSKSAGNEIASVTDIADEALSFLDKSILQIVNGSGTVIDKIGNPGIGTELSQINLSQLAIDPSYINSLNINMRTIKNLVVRRKRKVQSGKPVFSNEDILKDWAIYPNLDVSDLGEHVNACMMPVLSWLEWDPLNAPEAIREEAGPNPTVFGTIKSSEVLTGDVIVFFEISPHEFLIPSANEAENIFDYDSPVDNPDIDWTLDEGFDEFPFELCTVLADANNQEGNEGVGFNFDVDENSPTPATTELDEDLFDVLIMEGTNSTHSVELAQFIKVYPSIVQTSTTVEVSGDNMTIRGVSIFDSKGRLLKDWELPDTKKADLDLSFLPVRGMYSIILDTSKGVTSKKILKF